jgi:putative spermidine/putrescine transport system permease protein
MIPAFTLHSYFSIFEGCSSLNDYGDVCVTLKTYWSTVRISLVVWLVTLVLGFAIAYFLAFCVRSSSMQTLLFVLCTVPFWTSNVIRMISWIPLLGRNGLVNQTLMNMGLVNQPVEWLLFSEFSVVLAFVHLYTMFMIVPIFNSMMRIDRSLIEAAYDTGASAWQTLWNVIIPLSRTGIIIGSIFVITIVMGDFVTIGVMGGQQIASVGKIIQVQTSFLQFPLAAANAVILLLVVLMIIWGLTRLVDIRKEL